MIVHPASDGIEGHNILCFAPGPWDDIWRNRHQIMSRLARANRVLYVEPWPYLRPTLRLLRTRGVRPPDARGPCLKRGGRPRLSQPRSNLWVYQPPLWAPRAARFPLDAVTQAVYMALLGRVLRRLHFESPILWLFLPDMEVFIGRFGEKLVIYHIVDEYAGYSGVSESWRPVLREMERRLARRADLVFVTSPGLLERKRELNERVCLVPNAVDYGAFAAVTGRGTPPADVAGLPSPIVGYVGAINDKVDMALLAYVARNCRDGSLILVGPATVTGEENRQALEELHTLPNVHLLGRKSADEVPKYVAACDVCLLPYRINEWTRNIDSLKLYEYLACGKPVVATDVPAAQRFATVVRIAHNEEEFVTSIRAALNEESPAMSAARRQIAAENTWDQRVASLSATIEDRLRERQERTAQ